MWMAYHVQRMEEKLQLGWSGLKSIQEQVLFVCSCHNALVLHIHVPQIL